MKGIARDGATTYTWDFGDGSSSTASASITDPYNLGVKHQYVGDAGDLFIATLTVSDGTDTHQDTYPVMIYESSDLSNPDHLDVRINMAIDEGCGICIRIWFDLPMQAGVLGMLSLTGTGRNLTT